MGVGKLEPLLKLNTSTCTHLFSFLFPSSSLLFSVFCASRNLFLLFFSSPFLPFQVDSTKTIQTWVSMISTLCFLPTHRELKKSALILSFLLTHRELKLCTRFSDFSDQSQFQFSVFAFYVSKNIVSRVF